MSTAHGATTCETLDAVGIGPWSPVNTNPMMANDFGFYCVKTLELARRFFSPLVPWSPPQSWRYIGDARRASSSRAP